MKIGFLGMLTLIFITLKLTGNIDWSWVLVLLPMLIPIGILALMSLLLGILHLYEYYNKGKL